MLSGKLLSQKIKISCKDFEVHDNYNMVSVAMQWNSLITEPQVSTGCSTTGFFFTA